MARRLVITQTRKGDWISRKMERVEIDGKWHEGEDVWLIFNLRWRFSEGWFQLPDYVGAVDPDR